MRIGKLKRVGCQYNPIILENKIENKRMFEFLLVNVSGTCFLAFKKYTLKLQNSGSYDTVTGNSSTCLI